MSRAVPLVCALLALPVVTHAQTVAKPDGQWRGAIGAGLTATSGNTEGFTLSVNGDAIRQTDRDKLSGYLQLVNGRQDTDTGRQTTAELARAGTTYNSDFDDRRFGFGNLDLERDGLINLNLRAVVAGGVGYHVIKREGLTFDVSTGPAYSLERYTLETREAIGWLFAEESTHAINPAVSFRQRLAYYPSINDGGEFRLVFDAGLVIKIAGGWNATISLNDRYQSNALPGVKKNDLLFVTGLQYVFNP